MSTSAANLHPFAALALIGVARGSLRQDLDRDFAA
jgi:hypothetical protein